MSTRALTRTAACALAALAGLAISLQAGAYGWDTCDGNKVVWNRGWTNMWVSTTSMPPDSVWDARLQNAMWHWNNVKRSGFTFYVGRDTDGTHQDGNGVTEVFFEGGLGANTLAVTRFRSHCRQGDYGIDETDVAFNTDQSWSVSPLDYADLDAPYSFEATALHEFGHVLGLNHEDRWLATLNSFYPDSGPVGHGKEWDPLSDDREGARFLYPDGTAETDIAGSVFKRTIAGESGLVASPAAVARGSSATIELTVHNLGTGTQSFNIGFYLSTNDIISTADRLLGTNTGAWLTAGASITGSRTLTIPSDVTPGRYWLGTIVDHDEQVGEAHEGNNSMEMPRPVQVN
jgi:CARDB protein/matrixin